MISLLHDFIKILFGVHYTLFVSLLFLNILDIVTGRIVAKKKGRLNSKDCIRGILKKALIWLIIYLGFLFPSIMIELGKVINLDFKFALLTGYFVLGATIINEFNSIIENLIALGVEIPKILLKGLKAANNKLNDENSNK